jgi:hypothetical protein
MLSLTYKPDNEPFPLLADEKNYVPDTFNIHTDQAELDYWLGILIDQVGPFVERAISSGLDQDETTGEIPGNFLLGIFPFPLSPFPHTPAACSSK